MTTNWNLPRLRVSKVSALPDATLPYGSAMRGHAPLHAAEMTDEPGEFGPSGIGADGLAGGVETETADFRRRQSRDEFQGRLRRFHPAVLYFGQADRSAKLQIQQFIRRSMALRLPHRRDRFGRHAGVLAGGGQASAPSEKCRWCR